MTFLIQAAPSKRNSSGLVVVRVLRAMELVGSFLLALKPHGHLLSQVNKNGLCLESNGVSWIISASTTATMGICSHKSARLGCVLKAMELVGSFLLALQPSWPSFSII